MTLRDLSPNLTPKHIRAARALLAWSQQDLAKAASVATSTVADFERGQRTPVANNAQAIRQALEAANIRFLPNGAVIGPFVPTITPSERRGTPIRWVDSGDLLSWADRTDCATSLPTLIAHLVRAAHSPVDRLRFPAAEGVRHSGWDGITSTDAGNNYVPQGDAGWEMSCQRNNVAGKADEDYQKRTTDPKGLEQINTTFVFVTPRHWPQKDLWKKERLNDGVWRGVQAYDVDDLVHWIEQTPAVGLWLATKLGKRPAGVRELDNFWEEWARATRWPLTEDLVLCDRDQDAIEVLRWLRSKPSVLSLQATTTEEVVAFFHATLSMLPDDIAAFYRARCLVATTVESARALVNAPGPLILLLTEPEPGLSQVLVDQGHFVLQAYDERQVSPGQIRVLAPPSFEGIASALTGMGIEDAKARAYARDSARNLAVLRRIIPMAPRRLPSWAQEPPPHALLAALLAGGWDGSMEADQARIAEIAGQPYEDVIATLTTYCGDFDSPLRNIGSTWHVASPWDAWFLLARYLTHSDITRFESAAYAVIGSADPRFEMPPGERWMAALRGIRREYSGALRRGIGQVLILLALHGKEVRTVSDVNRRADVIVGKLLSDADSERWWSLSQDFRLLAEASPEAFLGAVEDSLSQSNPPIQALFDVDGGGMFGTERLSNLLWALESLAWSPDWMPRVSLILAQLAAIDSRPEQYANRPSNSLRNIYLLWSPQTYATLEQRLKSLDLIRRRESAVAWKLMLSILPSTHDMFSPSPLPRWRDFIIDAVEDVTWELIRYGATEITKALIEDAALDAKRWVLLLGRIDSLVPNAEFGLTALESAEEKISDRIDRSTIWTSIRSVLHRHRQFPEAQWSLPANVLDRLEAIYRNFTPSDPIERIAWLFKSPTALPNPSTEGWEAEQRQVDSARREAVQVLFSHGGVAALMALARQTGGGGYIGKALLDSDLSDANIDKLLETALRSDNEREHNLAHGIIAYAFPGRKEPWAEALLARAREESWGEKAILTVLLALPVLRWTWKQVEQAGATIEDAYWRQAPVAWVDGSSEDITFAIRKLISVNRARHALPLAVHEKKSPLSSTLLVELLQEAARQPFESDGDINAPTMFQYYVTEILQALDGRGDVDNDVMVLLEWNYLPILEHSNRPAKVLLMALSEQPSLFVEMISAVFRASEDSGVDDPEPKDPEHARAVANQAYRLLELWNRLPGTREDGSIDVQMLENWIKNARLLAKAVGREDVADDRIGRMLSASPVGTDGNWPAEAVREVLETFRSKPMTEGFWIGKRNRQGVTTRMPRDGGALERKEASIYRNWAKAIAYEYPQTARVLHTLADSYEDDARREDEDAERANWTM